MPHTPTQDLMTDPDILEYVGTRFDNFLEELFQGDDALDRIYDWTASYFPQEFEGVVQSIGHNSPEQLALEQAEWMTEWAVARTLCLKLLEYIKDTEVPTCCKCEVPLGWTGKNWIHPLAGVSCPMKEVW